MKNVMRVTRIDEILNIGVNTNKIKQILKKLEKKKKENCKIYRINHSEKQFKTSINLLLLRKNKSFLL